MINALQNGFDIFQNHFWLVILILAIIIWGQMLMQKLLIHIFGNQFNEGEYFSLAFAGWLLPVICWSILYFLFNFIFGKTIASIFSFILFCVPLGFIRFKKPSLQVVLLSSFLLASLLLRLAWLEQAIFPSYFDSAEHYKNIQKFLRIYENDFVSLFYVNYYHLGYHFLSASLIHLLELNSIPFMLVFGQIVLTLLPFSFFFLLKQITQSNAVAFFTCLIAGFGFHMPAHLINWGKYPALLSLVGFQFVLCLGYIFATHHLKQAQKSKLYWLIGTSILISTLIHTRILIALVLVSVSFFISYSIHKLSIRYQYISFLLVFTALGMEIYSIAQNPALSPLITGYTQRDLWSLILVLFLIPFSIKPFRNLSFFLLASIGLFVLPLFFPISFFQYGTHTLLDRPFVQILFYIPLSMVAGLGFSGLLSVFQNKPYINSLISLALFGFVLININFNYKFYPSECCQLVSRDDLTALTWIEKNIPDNENILIAVTQLNVTSYEPSSPAAVDAGIWITPLTNRITPIQFIGKNFETDDVHQQLCKQNINHIYVGSLPDSFNQNQLANKPNWYQAIFLLPKAQIYQVIGCN